MILVCCTFYLIMIVAGDDAIAVPGTVIVTTLLDIASVNNSNRFMLLERCLTT